MIRWLLIGTLLSVFSGLGQLGNEQYKTPAAAFFAAFFFMMLIVSALPISILIANLQLSQWMRSLYASLISLLAGIIAAIAFHYSIITDDVGVEFVTGPDSDVAFTLPIAGSQLMGLCIFIVYIALSIGSILFRFPTKSRT